MTVRLTPRAARILFAALGVVLVLTGLLMPRGWYDSVPPLGRDYAPPRIDGVLLLRATLLIEGALLLLASAFGVGFTPIPERERVEPYTPPDEGDLSTRAATIGITLITLLALVLRLYRVNTDLWLDEITPIIDYGGMPAWKVIATYISSNNHLLNTILVNWSIAAFGEHDWSARLPAVLFGIATVPVTYWAARLAMSRRSSLAAALLVAVSYHHIFFSQNARGYSAYLLFSVSASVLLARGLQRDRFEDWAGFIVVSVLNVASQLLGFFVLASHGLVGLAAIWRAWRKEGAFPRAIATRVIAAFAIAGFLSFQLYALAVPKIAAVMTKTYAEDSSSGYPMFSLEFVRELVGGLAAGFGPGKLAAALPFLAIAGIVALVGCITLLKRQWVLALALMLPLALTVVLFGVRSLQVSPRFLLLGLPLAAITAVAGIDACVAAVLRWWKRPDPALARRWSTALIVIMALMSLVSLRNYYRIPKQPYRQSMAYVDTVKKPGDAIIVVYLAQWGYAYYTRNDPGRAADYHYVRTAAALDSVASAYGPDHTYLVTTLPRVLREAHPDLYQRITDDWVRVKSFPGSIGGGDITIWRRKS